MNRTKRALVGLGALALAASAPVQIDRVWDYDVPVFDVERHRNGMCSFMYGEPIHGDLAPVSEVKKCPDDMPHVFDRVKVRTGWWGPLASAIYNEFSPARGTKNRPLQAYLSFESVEHRH